MALALFSRKLSTTATVAAGLTLLAWWLFSFVTPDQPLGVAETALVFVVLFGLAHGGRALWRRWRGPPPATED